MYPVSLIAHGGALNITCLSYDGSLNFGYTGCRTHCQACRDWRFITGEALDELESLILPPKAKSGSGGQAQGTTKAGDKKE